MQKGQPKWGKNNGKETNIITRKFTRICENVGNSTIKSRERSLQLWLGMALKTVTIKATNISLFIAKI